MKVTICKEMLQWIKEGINREMDLYQFSRTTAIGTQCERIIFVKPK